jgi:hypothetical protein
MLLVSVVCLLGYLVVFAVMMLGSLPAVVGTFMYATAVVDALLLASCVGLSSMPLILFPSHHSVRQVRPASPPPRTKTRICSIPRRRKPSRRGSRTGARPWVSADGLSVVSAGLCGVLC